MMPDYFPQAVNKVMQLEGGFSNHPHDAGGKTIYGIASASWPEWYEYIMEAYRNGESGVAQNRARQFYHQEIWQRRPFASIKHEGVAVFCFDGHVNHSFRGAGGIIQRACNHLIHGLRYQPLATDGWMGQMTVRRLNALCRRYDDAVMTALFGERYLYYRRLVERNSSQAVFMRGWLARLHALTQ